MHKYQEKLNPHLNPQVQVEVVGARKHSKSRKLFEF